ncbi:MAG: T9SS type A sorting domain-containing protein [Lentimicrobium sp.]|nr:T9SS type A sorting domain-containing protein [Lentimicrobium sp.]
MKKIITLLLALSSTAIFAQNQTGSTSTAELFKNDGEIYFNLPGAAGFADVLTKIISIDKISGDTVYAYASRKEFENLRKLGSRSFNLLPHPGDLIDPAMSSDTREVLDWNYYPTYPVYVQLMEQFAATYPDICKLYNIGTLPSGRELLVARISDNVGIEEDEPEFFYTSTMHGDETTGYVLMLHLIDYLLTNYGQDPRVTALVNEIDIWINPLANPDGTYYGGNNTVNGARRYNANFVDLNRNYPDPADGPHPDGNPWQPETLAFMNFAEQRSFVMGANFHGGAEVVNYPWDTWSRLAADNQWWVMVSHEYADTAQAFSPSGYFNDYNNGITNGYAWYSINGGRQDYMNYFQQCREVTLEISATKLPPASQLLNFWNYNYRSLLNYMEQVTYGVRGIVTDTLTGEPVKAQISIFGHDMDSSMVFTSLPVGNYHRLLKAGSYNITFTAEGYLPKVINNVMVGDKSSVRLDVKLWNGSPLAAFTSSTTTVPVGGEVAFIDISFGNPTFRLWTFEGADISTSTEVNPTVTYNEPGIWDVSLFVENSYGSNQLNEPDYITVTPDYYIGVDGSTTCFAGFYDSQGPDKNYKDNENLTTTFYAADAEKVIRVHFIAFDVEQSADCEKDALFVYDGPDPTYPLIGRFCGNEIPSDIFSSTEGGAITFVFISDEANNFPGWIAELSCDDGVGVITHSMRNRIIIFPNPSSGDGFKIESDEIMLSVEVSDMSGRVVYSQIMQQKQLEVTALNAIPGIYNLKVTTLSGVTSHKLIMVK